MDGSARYWVTGDGHNHPWKIFRDRLRDVDSVGVENGPLLFTTSGSAIAEGPRDVLVSRNSATTKYRYRVALFV